MTWYDLQFSCRCNIVSSSGDVLDCLVLPSFSFHLPPQLTLRFIAWVINGSHIWFSYFERGKKKKKERFTGEALQTGENQVWGSAYEVVVACRPVGIICQCCFSEVNESLWCYCQHTVSPVLRKAVCWAGDAAPGCVCQAVRSVHCPPSSLACSGVTGKEVLRRTGGLSYCVFWEMDKSTDYLCAVLVYHIEDEAEQNLQLIWNLKRWSVFFSKADIQSSFP